MFNPKQALERIRKGKVEKDQTKSVISESPNNNIAENEQSFNKELFGMNNSNGDIGKRVSNLEEVVMRLTDQLTLSNESVSKLKRENSHLETQLLKLEYENVQLRNSNMVSEMRQQSATKSYNNNNSIINSSVLDRSHLKEDRNHSYQKSFMSERWANEKETARKIESQIIQEESHQRFSPEVQQVLEQVKKEPLQNILKKREYQFRALKATSRQLQKGNEYLQKLANLQKEYGKTMKKPVLLVKFDENDFQ